MSRVVTSIGLYDQLATFVWKRHCQAKLVWISRIVFIHLTWLNEISECTCNILLVAEINVSEKGRWGWSDWESQRVGLRLDPFRGSVFCFDWSASSSFCFFCGLAPFSENNFGYLLTGLVLQCEGGWLKSFRLIGIGDICENCDVLWICSKFCSMTHILVVFLQLPLRWPGIPFQCSVCSGIQTTGLLKNIWMPAPISGHSAQTSGIQQYLLCILLRNGLYFFTDLLTDQIYWGYWTAADLIDRVCWSYVMKALPQL